MGFGERGDVQLLEISGRARRLSHMVSSWFKVADLDGGSKNASRGLPKTKEKAGFSGKGEFVEGGELQGSRRLAALEEERLCGSRSWRSCGEELKEVIRDSLYGRSLLPNSSDDEKASSSRSLGFHPRSGSNAARYEEGVDRRNPITASGQPMQMKAPSLIARLMGLEQVPADSIKRKQRRVGAAPEARRSMLQNMERSRRFDMDDEATSSRRGAKQEELGSRKTSGRRVVHESERKEVEILKKTEARWSKKSGMAAASACDGRQKSGLDRRQAQSIRDVKTAAAPVDHAKKTRAASTEPRKQSIAFGRGRPRQPVSRSSTSPASTEKKVAAQKTAKLKTTEKKDGEGITDPCRKAEDASATNVTPAAQPPEQRRLHPRAAINEKIMCEIMPKPSRSPGKAKAAVAKRAGSEAGNTAKREDKEGYLEALLLSLLSHAHRMSLAELKQVDEDAKLYWDCAEESVARKRRHRDLRAHPLLPACWRSSSAHEAAMDKLAGEISRGMRRLAGYGEAGEEVASTDGLYVRLERDLRCGDWWLNAMWDLGWRNGICVEEVDGVVGQVEERVMSALLEELAMELKH